VVAKDPEIAGPRNGGAREGLEIVCQVQFVRGVERLDAKVDFRELEADVLDLEIDGELGQLLEASGQGGVVPGGPVGELCIRSTQRQRFVRASPMTSSVRPFMTALTM
jgi:hypothetical protein